MVTTTGGRKKLLEKLQYQIRKKIIFALIFRVLQILCKGDLDLFCFIYVIKLMNERGSRSFKQVRLYAKKTVQQQQRQHANASNVNKHHQYRPLTQ